MKGIEACKHNLCGRLVMNKGDKPYTFKDIREKLLKRRKTSGPWKMISLGKGFYEFSFSSFEDLHLVLTMRTINMKLGVLCPSQWMKDFNAYTQLQTHPRVWIRLVELPRNIGRITLCVRLRVL